MNDTSGFLAALKCTKFVFGPGLYWGSLQRSQDPLAGIRPLYILLRGRGRGGREERKMNETGATPTLSLIPGSAPKGSG